MFSVPFISSRDICLNYDTEVNEFHVLSFQTHSVKNEPLVERLAKYGFTLWEIEAMLDKKPQTHILISLFHVRIVFVQSDRKHLA